MSSCRAFFQTTGSPGSFRATVHTRGPWNRDHQHAGPPAALLARAIEQALPQDTPMQVARISMDILRPVPIATLTTRVECDHDGRSVKSHDATLHDAQGKLLMRARALSIRTQDIPVPAPANPVEPPPPVNASRPFEPPFFTSDVGYHKAIEWRIAAGEFGSGSLSAWMRMRMPLVAGETTTPLQRVMSLADSGSGVSLALDVQHYSFLNPDLGVYLHRMPVGEWLCLQARTLPQDNGIALADTLLHDATGPIGRAAQALIIQSLPARKTSGADKH